MKCFFKGVLMLSTASFSVAVAAETTLVDSEMVIITGTATQSTRSDADVVVPVVEEVVEEPKREDNCTGMLMLSAQTQYPLQDLGVDASGGTPVTQNMLGAACGKFFFDVSTSTTLSTEGSYGERGVGDEIDIEASYTDTVGPFRVTGKAALFMVDFGRGLDSLRDDLVSLSVDIGHSVETKSVTVEPYLYVARVIGVSDIRDFSIFRPGIRFSGPVDQFNFQGVTYNLEVAYAWNDVSFGDQNVWRGELMFSKSISDSWTVTAGAKATENIGITPLVRMNLLF